MNAETQTSSESPLPEELPPVKPPSIGFIMQLFVVPGLIVGAIVAVWLLFGRLAASDQDWRRQVLELQNPNEHRRWRGALGLSQILKADLDRQADSQHLAENPELIGAITALLTAELDRNGQREEDFQFQAFLARTLGLLDVPEAILPVLRRTMQPGVDREVRKNALGSVAVMVDRLSRRDEPIAADSLAAEVVQSSFDGDALIRQLAAFTLGLFDTPDSRRRLLVLLGDDDRDVRINSAIALARRHDRGGVAVLRDVFAEAEKPTEKGSSDEFARFLAVRNSLTALGRLIDLLTDAEREDFARLIQPIAHSYREPEIRIAALSTLQTLTPRQ